MSDAATLHSVGALAAPWTGVTLADLFVSTVRMNGQSLALRGVTPDGPAALTYAQADAAVERIIERLEELVLDPGAPVAVALPASVEAPLALFAVLQAGFMPCLLPVTLDPDAMRGALAASGAKAVITVGAVGTLRPAERIRAACVFEDGPRYVLAFGSRLPGGVIPLDTVMHHASDTAVRARPAPPRYSAPPIMTVGSHDGRLVWHRQDQEGLVATGLSLILRANVASGEPILSTLAPASAAALATGLVPALLTGGALHVCGPFTAAGFVEAVAEAGRCHLVVPAALEAALEQSGLLAGQDLATAVLLHRPPAIFDGPPRAGSGTPVIDALALGEHALLIARRPPGGASAIALGEVRIPDEPDGALVIASREGPDGYMEVSGAAAGIPLGHRPRATETEWTDTAVRVRCDDEGTILLAVAD